jgi:hypothetical protein
MFSYFINKSLIKYENPQHIIYSQNLINRKINIIFDILYMLDEIKKICLKNVFINNTNHLYSAINKYYLHKINNESRLWRGFFIGV